MKTPEEIAEGLVVVTEYTYRDHPNPYYECVIGGAGLGSNTAIKTWAETYASAIRGVISTAICEARHEMIEYGLGELPVDRSLLDEARGFTEQPRALVTACVQMIDHLEARLAFLCKEQ